MSRIIRQLLCSRYNLVWLCLLVSACGFHLRSYNFEGAVASYAIIGQSRSSIAEPLRLGLKQAGINESARNEAVLLVDLLEQRRDRRSISTAGNTRAAEYEISFAVQYRLLGADNVELTAPTWITREQVYRIDRTNIVGSSEEQAIVERELLQDVAGQIIRAMDAVSRNLPTPSNANQG